MKKQEQIDALRNEIERIKEHIGLPYIYIHKGNLNHSGKPNSCDRVADIAISRGVARESTQYELPDFVPDWKDAPQCATYLAMDKDGQWWWYGNKAVISSMSFIGDWINSYPGQCTNASRLHPDYWKQSLQERPEPDYTHLLPAGYEFCTEHDAEKWVKVELAPDASIEIQNDIGFISSPYPLERYKQFYRPIRPIQFHISVHEAVTAEPDPYQVDWEKAPEWADCHSYQDDGVGFWHGTELLPMGWRPKWAVSGFKLPTGLDWKQSKTINPKLK